MAKKGKKNARAGDTGNVSAYAARQQANNEAMAELNDVLDTPGPHKKRKRALDTAVEVPSKKKRYKGNRHSKSQSKAQQSPASASESDDEARRSVDAEPTDVSIVKQSKEEVTISLDDCPLTLVGLYSLSVGQGAVSVCGAVLHSSLSAYHVYAPATHPLPVIRPVRDPYRPAEDQPVEVTISSIQNGMRSLKEVSAMFARIWKKPVAVSDDVAGEMDCIAPSLDRFKHTFSLVKTAEKDDHKRSMHSLELPDDWQHLLTALALKNKANPPITALVCGPKGSGRSSFTRMLVNAIVTKRTSHQTPRRIAFLDADPGQPEYSPPGEVSLVEVTSCNLAQPFCHPSPSTHGLRLLHSHHVGATSPTDDPDHYMRCVWDLFQHYHQVLADYPSCPLVVHTGGRVQGKGLEILCNFISQLQPTDVIYTSTQGPKEVTDSITQATETGGHSLHFISSQSTKPTSRTVADLQQMQQLSYFHLDRPEDGILHWAEIPVDYMVTLQLRYAGLEQDFYGVRLVGNELDPELLIDVLQGCIVGLAVVEEDETVAEEGPAVAVAGGATVAVSEGATVIEEEDEFSMMDLDTDPDMIYTPKRGVGPLAFHDTAPPSTPLPRNSEGIPYFPATAKVTPPLDPAHSHCLGQALIRSVDTESQTFHLITPVRRSAIDSVRNLEKKLVLVRGKLEAPGWFPQEDLHYQMRQRKKDVKQQGLSEWTQEDTEMWAEGRDYIRAGGLEQGEQKKKVRRDLGKPKKP
ncbi:MAG: hypothetical protein Q9168_001297 [Polycauliona sp. 1 TL-2023]